MGIVEELRQEIIQSLGYRLIKDYNELTYFIKSEIIRLLRSKYDANPVDNDPSRLGFCEIGGVIGEHYPIRKMNYSVWVANSSTAIGSRSIKNPTLEQALQRRQQEIEHSRKTKTRITYDVTVIFSDQVMYLVEGGGKADPAEFKDFVAQANSDIEKLLIGIAKVKDAFKFCDKVYPHDPDLSLHIDDDIIERMYKLEGIGIESLINRKMSKLYTPPKRTDGIQNLAA